jgi:hypothetical protein
MKRLIILLVFISFSCNDNNDDDVYCTEDLRAGLVVVVKDASTGETLGEGVTVTATDGEYSDELYFIASHNHFVGAYERAGDYVLTVEKEGYADFTSEVIPVDEDECHVITENVTVQLQPE